MAVAYPTSINDKFQQGTFREAPIDEVIMSTMDVGGVKQRRRTTRMRYKITGAIEMSAAEYTTLKTFYDVSLSGGSISVLFTHPLELVEKEYNMKYSAVDAGAFDVIVQMQLEEV